MDKYAPFLLRLIHNERMIVNHQSPLVDDILVIHVIVCTSHPRFFLHVQKTMGLEYRSVYKISSIHDT